MTKDNDEFESNDLVLVTALRCNGFEPTDLFLDEGANSVYWVFKKDPELVEAVGKFALGEASVEPKEFNTLYVSTKDDMFKLLKAEGKRPRTRVR